MSAPASLAEAGRPVRAGRCAPLVLATDLGDARGGLAVAAAVGVTAAVGEDPGSASGVLLAELGAEGRRGPTMLASAQARELEEGLRDTGFEPVAARGRLCWLGLPSTEEGLGDLPRRARGCGVGQAGDRPPARAAVAAGPRAGRPASTSGSASRRSPNRPRAGGAGGGGAAGAGAGDSRRGATARPGRLASRSGGPGGWRCRRHAGRPAGARPARPCRGARRGAGPGPADDDRRGLRDPVRGGAC